MQRKALDIARGVARSGSQAVDTPATGRINHILHFVKHARMIRVWLDSHASMLAKINRQVERKEDMKIAVTYENGNVFQHFGHTQQFKVYEVEGDKVADAQVVDTNGSGHGALAGFLSALNVDSLICGGIGAGAQIALAEAGIRLYGGVSGSADDAVDALIAGKLDFDPDVHCDHHAHDGGEHCHHGCPGHDGGCHA